MRASWLAAAAALGAACSYSYRNPAEALGPGEVSGRTVAGVEVVVDGVSVSVKNAGLDAVSRQNGHFSMLPLPVGRHTLVFRKGTERALQRDVEIAFGKDGQPQGVWLGDVTLPAAVGLSGTVSLPASAAAAPVLAPGGVALDEESGTIAPLVAGTVGSYTLDGLAIGDHRIRVYATDTAGKAYVGGPARITLGLADAGTRKTVTRLALHPVAATAGGAVSVSFRLAVAGNVPGLSLAGLQLAGLPAGAVIQSNGFVQASVSEGLWTVQVSLPAGVAGATPPPLRTFAAVGGETIDLGTFLVVSDAAQQQALSACHVAADCAPDACLPGGICGPGYRSPQVAPAAVPFCARETQGCALGLPIGGGPVATMTCVAGPSAGATIGVACGGCCTPDGVATVCGLPGNGGCPALLSGGGGTGHAVSGTVTGTAVSGVTLLLADQAASHFYSATSDGTGAFTLTGVADGNYTLVPALGGQVFTPLFRTVDVAGADVAGQDFVSANGFTVSGHVTGAVLSGVTLQLTPQGGANLTATTDASGAYTFSGLPANGYTITPALAGYTFTPPSVTFGLGADITTMDFAASAQVPGTHAVSGMITGPVVVGVQVSILGPGADTGAITGFDGAYRFTGLPDGSYDITPYLPGYVFTPPVRTVALAGADLAGQDFVLRLPVLSGHVTGSVLGGVTIRLADVGGANLSSTATDAAGFYTFGGLAPASYTLTPVLAGFSFNPPTATFVLSSDTTVDFAAILGAVGGGGPTPRLHR